MRSRYAKCEAVRLQRVSESMHSHLIGELKHFILTVFAFIRYIITRDLIYWILNILVPAFMRVRYLEMFDL